MRMSSSGVIDGSVGLPGSPNHERAQVLSVVRRDERNDPASKIGFTTVRFCGRPKFPRSDLAPFVRHVVN
jgi:hypothetical protein